jgi:hypothetical protein
MAMADQNMSKIAGIFSVVIMMLDLVPTTAGAAECPDSALILAGTRIVCVARDKVGKCIRTERRLLVYCPPQLPHSLY